MSAKTEAGGKPQKRTLAPEVRVRSSTGLRAERLSRTETQPFASSDLTDVPLQAEGPVQPLAQEFCGALVRLDGIHAGEQIPLDQLELLVGRTESAEVRLFEHGVSRAHARIVVRNEFWIEDCGSKNGTVINGKRITSRKLEDGDIIEFGPQARLRFVSFQKVRQQAQTGMYDFLTGAFSRCYFDQRLSAEIAQATRHERSCSLALFELDQFSNLKTASGHHLTQKLLRQVAMRSLKVLRTEDILARYADERFALLLSETPLPGACATLERVRDAVHSYHPQFHGPVPFLTLSAGCAELSECPSSSPQALLEIARQRLDLAKQLGGNRSLGQRASGMQQREVEP